MHEADGTILLFSTKHMGRKRKLIQRLGGQTLADQMDKKTSADEGWKP